ncbi:hypothetical protein VTJ04DRAFT_516 [Mycothermus thermophilus]|uniref:uncharacterized protein n=1 Tax=Humicola insolens TaxID=85995 RepID=UPI00374259C9
MSTHPSFFGFVATTMDAVILIEAARYGIITTFIQTPDFDTTPHSGAIFVVVKQDGPGGLNRWRDSRSWTNRRPMGNGFDLYREVCKAGDAPISPELRAFELNNRPQLYPVLGARVGIAEAKENGLLKKTLSFDFNGYTFMVVNYYALADVLFDRLPRPRHLAIGLTIRYDQLPTTYWNAQYTAGGHKKQMRIVDDGGVLPAGWFSGWWNAPEVQHPNLPPNNNAQ